MAVGDWASGTTIQLSAGTTIQITSTGIVVTAVWTVFLPSGETIYNPGNTPYTYTVTDPTTAISNSLTVLAQGLADQEGVPVVIPTLGITIQPR